MTETIVDLKIQHIPPDTARRQYTAYLAELLMSLGDGTYKIIMLQDSLVVEKLDD